MITQPAATCDDLTAQQAQIARLAADGLTSQEIGAQRFISTHTRPAGLTTRSQGFASPAGLPI